MVGKIKNLRKALAEATTYERWIAIALELDYLERKVEWKESFRCNLYNYELIYHRLNQLKVLHEQKNVAELARALREGLHHDLGNMGNPALYERSHVGTKHLIEEYVSQVCFALNYVCDSELPDLAGQKKVEFFKDTLLSFGRPALLLSGGASLGVFHIGVVKALWTRGLLPKIIAGSSVGSIIAGMLGTHTDAELPGMWDPETHNLRAWKWNGLFKGFLGKGFMDPKTLRACLRSNIGEFSFQEAYERTGRSINITVSPTEHHQMPRLLSRYTSPYLLVWSASQASCSVPGIFPPTKLLKKDESGELTAYMPKLRWVDGSVVSDLPIERLMHLYDVNFSIVSQTNPHIVPFLTHQKNRQNAGMLTWPGRFLKSEVEFRGKALFDFLRKRIGPEALRQLSGQAYTILAQSYYGDVTIAPQYDYRHYASLLKNPTNEFVNEMILAGERATWPKIAMIKTHAKISQTLEKCIARAEEKCVAEAPVLRLKKGNAA
ncbi:MAG: DUF3336 domain-containing protein [Pseudomonadales bacterium]|nr:DUF3336 domain-containing protein [Pseudomonadales bacterium]